MQRIIDIELVVTPISIISVGRLTRLFLGHAFSG